MTHSSQCDLPLSSKRYATSSIISATN